MVVSSLIVETLPEHRECVAKRLGETSNVEVHGVQDYQVIVTIEADTVDESHDIANSFVGIEGVRGINLVYVNFEDDHFIKEASTRR